MLPHSGNYLHSPQSWEELWTKVFIEVESAEFAQKHLQFSEEFSSHYGGLGVKNLVGEMPEMFWSVKVV